MPASLAIMRMREGSTSVGLSRETTAGWRGESGCLTSVKRVLLVHTFFSA